MNTFNHKIKLSKELCELIGAYIGDGCLSNHNHGRTYDLQFSGHINLDYNYYKNLIAPIIKKLFNKEVSFIKIRNKKAFRMRCYSKEIGSFFMNRFNFILGKKTYIIKIPDEIMNSNKNYIYATVRGIFDTDGCIFFDKRKIYRKPYPRITLQITSKNLQEQLKKILSVEFKIFTTINKRGVYCLEIYGYEQINKWMKIIGFSNEKHLNRLYAPVAQHGRAQV